MKSHSEKTLIILLTLFIFPLHSQLNVTQIITDHNGFSICNSASVQEQLVVKQNLLAFQTGNMMWSTGVNNAVLTSNGVNYVPTVFTALPASIGSPNANAVIGVGKLFGGFVNGSNGCSPAVQPPFGGSLSSYLTDGPNGLDLSTAIFNIGGSVLYTVSTIDPTSIGDGIPDIVVTQTGDLNSNVWDQFRFTNESGATVGNAVSVNFTTVPIVAKPHWKFYSLQGACGGSTAGTRDLRLLAFDFSSLGITVTNYTQVKRFVHQLTPNTDMAFVAYNTISATILPITLVDFKAELYNEEVVVSWTSALEINNDYFTVQRSKDGYNWEDVKKVDGHGSVNHQKDYSIIDSRPFIGVSYYRLMQTDFDGTHTFSTIVAVERNNSSVEIFPNPASQTVTILADSFEDFQFVNTMGQSIFEASMIVNQGSNVLQLNVANLPQGFYLIYVEGKAYQVVVE